MGEQARERGGYTATSMVGEGYRLEAEEWGRLTHRELHGITAERLRHGCHFRHIPTCEITVHLGVLIKGVVEAVSQCRRVPVFQASARKPFTVVVGDGGTWEEASEMRCIKHVGYMCTYTYIIRVTQAKFISRVCAGQSNTRKGVCVCVGLRVCAFMQKNVRFRVYRIY